MFDWNQSVDLTRRLCRYDTYAAEGKRPALEEIASIIRERTDARVAIHECGTGPYLVAALQSPSPAFRLLLEGHVDVVSPEGVENPFDAALRGGALHGRGTADMKSGCAAMLTGFLAAAEEPGRRGDLYLMYSTDEEYAGEQIIDALEREVLPKCDFAMIAEPTGLQLCNAHKGELWVDVDFFGKSAHSSTPELGKNAIYMAAAFVQKLRAYAQREYPAQRHPIYGAPTLNVGVVTGGSTPNLVPPHAQVRIDKRYLPGHTGAETMEEIASVLAACRAEDPDFRAEAKAAGDWDAVIVERDLPVFKAVRAAIGRASGGDAPLGVMDFWGEGGFIQRYGIPVVYYGPGHPRYAHTPDEQCPVDQIVAAAKAYHAIIQTLC